MCVAYDLILQKTNCHYIIFRPTHVGYNLPQNGPPYEKKMVNPRPQTSQGQPVTRPEEALAYFLEWNIISIQGNTLQCLYTNSVWNTLVIFCQTSLEWYLPVPTKLHYTRRNATVAKDFTDIFKMFVLYSQPLSSNPFTFSYNSLTRNIHIQRQ